MRESVHKRTIYCPFKSQSRFSKTQTVCCAQKKTVRHQNSKNSLILKFLKFFIKKGVNEPLFITSK